MGSATGKKEIVQKAELTSLTLRYETQFKLHMAIHEEGKFVCSQCGKQLITKRYLDQVGCSSSVYAFTERFLIVRSGILLMVLVLFIFYSMKKQHMEIKSSFVLCLGVSTKGKLLFKWRGTIR